MLQSIVQQPPKFKCWNDVNKHELKYTSNQGKQLMMIFVYYKHTMYNVRLAKDLHIIWRLPHAGTIPPSPPDIVLSIT